MRCCARFRFGYCNEVFPHTVYCILKFLGCSKMSTPAAKKSMAKPPGSSKSTTKNTSSQKRKKRGSKRAAPSGLQKLNESRSSRYEDRARSEKFKVWKFNTRQSTKTTGSGNFIRKAGKSILILFMLSHFIVLPDPDKNKVFCGTGKGTRLIIVHVMTKDGFIYMNGW